MFNHEFDYTPNFDELEERYFYYQLIVSTIQFEEENNQSKTYKLLIIHVS